MSKNRLPKNKAGATGSAASRKGKSRQGPIRLERLEVEEVDVGSIKPNKYNPNRQDETHFEMLQKSIEDDGFTQPIVVNRKTSEIVDGEHRWRIAKKIGYEKVPVVFVNMTDEQMRISTLRHNRARGQEVPELTAQVLKELEQLGALDLAKEGLFLTDLEVERMLEEADAAATLAAEEFGSAWLPVPSEKRTGSVDMEEDEHDGEAAAWATTESAAVANSQRKIALEKAKTEDEKRAILADKAFFRLTLTFTKNEWEKVKAVLGPQPAITFMHYIDTEYQKLISEEEKEEENEPEEKPTRRRKKQTA